MRARSRTRPTASSTTPAATSSMGRVIGRRACGAPSQSPSPTMIATPSAPRSTHAIRASAVMAVPLSCARPAIRRGRASSMVARPARDNVGPLTGRWERCCRADEAGSRTGEKSTSFSPSYVTGPVACPMPNVAQRRPVRIRPERPERERPMTQTEDVLADYVERLFAKASLLSLAVLGHGRLLEDGCLRPDGNRLDQLQSLATELEFGLGMLHDRLTERHELA